MGTVDAFWQANIDLTDFTPELNLWDRDWPIWTYSESEPPAKFIHDEDRPPRPGGVLDGVRAAASSRGPRSAIRCCSRRCTPTAMQSLDHAVVLPYVTVNRHARLRNVVIDSGVIIPEGLIVGEDPRSRRPLVPRQRGRRDR